MVMFIVTIRKLLYLQDGLCLSPKLSTMYVRRMEGQNNGKKKSGCECSRHKLNFWLRETLSWMQNRHTFKDLGLSRGLTCLTRQGFICGAIGGCFCHSIQRVCNPALSNWRVNLFCFSNKACPLFCFLLKQWEESTVFFQCLFP